MATALQLKSRPAEPLSTSLSMNGKILRFITMGETLKHGAPLDPASKAALVTLWRGTFEQIGEERFSAAFHKALLASPFRPDIADIRRFAGVVTESPETEATDELMKVMTAQRCHMKAVAVRFDMPHGQRNRGYLLRMIKGTETVIRRSFENPQGGMTIGPETPAPLFSDLTEQTIACMGGGDRDAGLETISTHPNLPQTEIVNDAFRVQRAEKLEHNWQKHYLLCKSRS